MWFIGTHSDVAGGDDPTHYNDCADITFAWMVEQCQGFLEFDGIYLAEVREDSQLRLREDREPGTSPTVGASGETHAATGSGTPAAPQSRYAMGHITDTFTKYYRILGSSYRKPGQYFRGDQKKGDTNQRIHPSVRIRRAKMPQQWEPPALRGFQVMPDPERLGYWVWKKGDIKIPEYPVGACVKKENAPLKNTVLASGEG
jgi:hypothetical protein